MFDDIPPGTTFLQFEAASLHQWQTSKKYDLITCIHGLHYIGDKLSLIERAASLADFPDAGCHRCRLCELAETRPVESYRLARIAVRGSPADILCGIGRDAKVLSGDLVQEPVAEVLPPSVATVHVS